MSSRASFSSAGLCLAVLAVAGCASNPEEDPVQIKLKDLDTRLARIERVMANQSLLDLANQDEAMRSDMRAVHNDVDQLTNSLEASRKQQRDLYADLDRRMKALESRGAAASPSAANPAAGSGDAGAAAAGAAASGASADASAPASDDRAAYQTAFALLKDSQYDHAIAAFQKFLVSFPASSLADNAQYWLGEAYYVNKSFPEAQNAFQRVVDKYPQSRKRPDALLKIGYCQYELKQWDSAKATLSQVATQFSDTPAGHLAQQRLDKMATEQH
ncbi:MAG TPA: tol-pal system protein YbgF [Steroidobacteraceae bacterium]|nr:tol-pal system protein YbgF [Steroidobacteraceae bacterium]